MLIKRNSLRLKVDKEEKQNKEKIVENRKAKAIASKC